VMMSWRHLSCTREVADRRGKILLQDHVETSPLQFLDCVAAVVITGQGVPLRIWTKLIEGKKVCHSLVYFTGGLFSSFHGIGARIEYRHGTKRVAPRQVC